jgi:hypothetical protein
LIRQEYLRPALLGLYKDDWSGSAQAGDYAALAGVATGSREDEQGNRKWLTSTA